jgi:hypothetical protein
MNLNQVGGGEIRALISATVLAVVKFLAPDARPAEFVLVSLLAGLEAAGLL